MDHESLVIVLSAGGSPLEVAALRELAGVTVSWAKLEREGGSACLAARVRCADPPTEFRERVRRWGSARGWTVTVAPCRPLC